MLKRSQARADASVHVEGAEPRGLVVPEQTTTETSEQKRRGQHMATAAYVVLAAGTIWVALLAADLLGSVGDLTFAILGLGAVIAAFVGIRKNEPTVKWPWIFIGAALAVFVVGGAVREAMGTLGNLTATRSPIPDLITIPGYFILGVGILGMSRARQRGREDELDAMLDAGVASLAILTLAWIYLVNPALFHASSPVSVRFALSAYPPLSVFLVAITARLAFSGGTRRVLSYQLLLAGLLLTLAGDVVYMLIEIDIVNVPKHLIDVPYALAFVGIIGCLLHPSMRVLTEPVPTDERAPSGARLALVAIALAIPGLIAVTRGGASLGDRVALGVIVMSLTGTAIFRMFRALRAHARSEARLAHAATHDVLTGLPNRVYVLEHVTSSLDRVRHQGGLVALLFLDLDRFKLVNDSHGHSLGDELLLAVAARLSASTRPSDTVARIGGDEFVIVVEGLRSVTEALEVAERTRLTFNVPFTLRTEVASTVSIGVSITDGRDRAIDAEAMIRDADAAMYQAKEAGRDAVTVFDTSMRDRAAQRLELERDLRHALERHELQLHYQPVVRLPDGEIEGFEALLRWSHPSRGQIPPMSFIPVAEDTGLIVLIGAWVVEEACRQLAIWRREIPGAGQLTMAVNVSARQLRDEHVVDTVRHAISTHRLPPEAIHLELTESVLMDNPTSAAELLNRLRGLGVKLSVDDFGTGYSSLAYLQRFAVDDVKIDRTFVDGLDRDDTSDESLVAAIIAMAGALKVTTIAEGVETIGQAHRLCDLGCDVAQGFLYSRPVPAEQVPATIERLGIARQLRSVPAAASEIA